MSRKAITLRRGEALFLRTCEKDGTSTNGFKWPKRGEVFAPDWDKTPECGYGLHGLLWGQGDGLLLNWSTDAAWIVFAASRWVDIDGQTCKVRKARVVYFGNRKDATDLVCRYAPNGTVCVGAFVMAGYSGTATAGDGGTATAGDSGTATAGDGGTATAGDWGTATVGYGGTATAGDWGTATAGDSGTIAIRHYDGSRYRLAVGYIGENGLKPNTAYKLDDKGNFVEAK
jgi:hypothetical protein